TRRPAARRRTSGAPLRGPRAVPLLLRHRAQWYGSPSLTVEGPVGLGGERSEPEPGPQPFDPLVGRPDRGRRRRSRDPGGAGVRFAPTGVDRSHLPSAPATAISSPAGPPATPNRGR